MTSYALVPMKHYSEKSRRLLRSVRTMPAYMEARLREDYNNEHYKFRQWKITSHVPASKGIDPTSKQTVDRKSATSQAIIRLKAFYDRIAEASETAFNKQSELWTIEPTNVALTYAVLRTCGFAA
jgi:hypothetical protein